MEQFLGIYMNDVWESVPLSLTCNVFWHLLKVPGCPEPAKHDTFVLTADCSLKKWQRKTFQLVYHSLLWFLAQWVAVKMLQHPYSLCLQKRILHLFVHPKCKISLKVMPNFCVTELGVNFCNCTWLCGGNRASVIIASRHSSDVRPFEIWGEWKGLLFP